MSPDLYDISAYDYPIPPELIAQNPVGKRDSSRLMRLSKVTGEIEHRRFSDLASLLHEGDLIVMNDTRVFKARVPAQKIPGGASVEIFFLTPLENPRAWRALVRPGRKLPPGSKVQAGGMIIGIEGKSGDGSRIVSLPEDIAPEEFFETCGHTPLPPYIKHSDAPDERYQTVYSDPAKNRSVAAPTAGLHFTRELLDELRDKGVVTEFLTLDVGIGTFRPVKENDIREHVMHSERCRISETCARAVNEAKSSGRRVIAVGTTAVRTLESFAGESGNLSQGTRDTDIFIKPGYRFKIPDAIITNFHLPKSTLLMLVSAFAGYGATMHAYAEAVANRYRFFSFGDAMLIE
ncbi:MAG: tRNA preQ1(34) S-adenosylmethionine ribosyltransferase-isomerase QueA [Synergistaceae bacterium]|nr:tRNA preQ1(34) S-adenosylmethionine ribosyltransferase-isomerase QueA [Synergistaceae bacterium]